MTVLILANNDIGLYQFRKELIAALCKRGDRVFISLPYGSRVEQLKEYGAEYIDTEFNSRGKNPFADIGLYRRYRKMIREVSPDVVLTYTIKPNIYGASAAARAGIPCLSNITGLGSSLQKAGLLRRIALKCYRVGLRRADTIFFQNEENYRFFLKNGVVRDQNVVMLPGSGVNLVENCPEPYPDDSNGVRFLYIGRIMQDKGVDEFIAAAEEIKRRHPDSSFDMIGDIYESAYEPVIEKAVARGAVKYHGVSYDVHGFIKNAHVTVLPSYHEGLANALLESASAERPVIASDIPGCRETFIDGVSGLSVEPRSVDSLVGAMERFISLPTGQKAAMGRAGREKIAPEFDRNIIVNAYLERIKAVTE